MPCADSPMNTRRKLLKGFLGILGLSFFTDSFTWRFVSTSWAKTKRILSRGFPREQIIDMNPADVDNRNLEIDPLDSFGTMGPTDIQVDMSVFRLKVTGKVGRPLSLNYDQILKYPSVTEVVLLICPGFFADNGRWKGVNLNVLLQEAQVKKEATYVDIRGAQEKVTRVSIKDLDQKKIFLAYEANGIPLPQKHGYPLRLVYEDAYGSDWVKYVDELVVL